MRRALTAVGLAVAGALVGLACVLSHALTVGLVLGVVASLATLLALPPRWETRLAFAFGWDAILVYALMPRSDGGYLISGDARGYTLLGLGLGIACVALVSSLRRDVRPPQTPSYNGPREAGT